MPELVNPNCKLPQAPSINATPKPIAANPYTPTLPLPPAYTYNQIKQVEQFMKTMQDSITNLTNQVNTLEQTYRIQFFIGNNGNVDFYKTYDKNTPPKLEIKGSQTTPVLYFTLVPPKSYEGPGPTGPNGDIGPPGQPGRPGQVGYSGFWGQQGNSPVPASYN